MASVSASNPRSATIKEPLLWRRRAAQIEIGQEVRRDRRWGVHHAIARDLILRKRDDVADVLFAARQHDDAVDAERHPAVRRRSIIQGAQKEPEAILDLFRPQA